MIHFNLRALAGLNEYQNHHTRVLQDSDVLRERQEWTGKDAQEKNRHYQGYHEMPGCQRAREGCIINIQT